MASMGIRNFNDLIGHSEYLNKRAGIEHWKAKGLDFSKIFYQPEHDASTAIYNCDSQDHELEKSLDNKLLAEAMPAIEKGKKVEITTNIINVNRTVGAMLAGKVAEKYGDSGMAEDTIKVNLHGTAGQSFAAFLVKGITFDLDGEANDYVGKSLSGGKVIIHPNSSFSGRSDENIICGNTCLYGATSGEAYISGVSGERFAVRNSGCTAVIEGVGDHGCEYMTGGTVVVLGKTGRNFAAGMSGGIAYVYDPNGEFTVHCNLAQVQLVPVEPASKQSTLEPRHLGLSDEEILRKYVSNHAAYTGSHIAKEILENWDVALNKFVKVFPNEYRKALADHAAKKEGE